MHNGKGISDPWIKIIMYYSYYLLVAAKANFVYSFKHEDVQSGSSTEKLYFVFGEAVQEPEVYYKRDFGSRIAQVILEPFNAVSFFLSFSVHCIPVWQPMISNRLL